MTTTNPPHKEDFVDNLNTEEIPIVTFQKVSRDPNFQILSHHPHKYNQRDEFSSNLEFTRSLQFKNVSQSLANIKPDLHNITPHRIPLEINNLKQAGKSSIKVPQKPHRFYEIEETAGSNEGKIPPSFNGTHPVPLYKFWPGNNIFYLKGKLMTGPKSDKKPNAIVWALIMGLNILFFAFCFPFLMGEVTPLFHVMSVFLCLSTITFFLMTSCTDPGIVPRRDIWELNEEEVPSQYKINLKRDFHSSDISSQLNISKGKSFSRSGSQNICHICNIQKRPKLFHCKHCENCVEEYARHCHFMRNCIGKRNFKYFLLFIVSLVLLSICYLLTFGIIIVTASTSDPNVDKSTVFQSSTSTIIILIVLGFPTFLLFIADILVFYYFFRFFCYEKSKKQGLGKISLQNKEENIEKSWYNYSSSHFDPQRLINTQKAKLYIKKIMNERIPENG